MGNVVLESLKGFLGMAPAAQPQPAPAEQQVKPMAVSVDDLVQKFVSAVLKQQALDTDANVASYCIKIGVKDDGDAELKKTERQKHVNSLAYVQFALGLQKQGIEAELANYNAKCGLLETERKRYQEMLPPAAQPAQSAEDVLAARAPLEPAKPKWTGNAETIIQAIDAMLERYNAAKLASVARLAQVETFLAQAAIYQKVTEPAGKAP